MEYYFLFAQRGEDNDEDVQSTSVIEELDGYRLRRQNCFTSVEGFVKETMPSIEDLLKKYKTGTRIMYAYDKQKELTRNQRSKIIDFIITYIDEQNVR